ncbi:hypothetical protein KJ925_05260, partial [Patescibacteria group bacterium]|nr:hypothetical protein [Patescibacteria group bacterium]
VLAKGQVVARDGELICPVAGQASAGMGTRPLTMARPMPEDFQVKSKNIVGKSPVIGVKDQTVTMREDLDLRVANGCYQPQGDVSAVSIISRDGSRKGQGFVKGFCPGLGGLAASISHEVHGLMVLGQNPEDMAQAASQVLDMQGGVSLVQNGQVRARIPLALGGICSLMSVQEVASQMSALHKELWDMGCKLPYPMWTFGFLSFTSILALRITYSGVYDVRSAETVF